MKTVSALAAALATSALALTASPQPAHAIKCSGPAQINKTTQIITPYCEHEYMARVARTYGFRTSGKRLRNNINHKQRICEHIGHDTRLSGICGGLRRENRGGRYNG